MEKELQPEESLQIIQKMIKASQQQFADKGIYMIIWAIVLILAALINYFLITSNLEMETINQWIIITWISFPVLAGIISLIVGFRQSQKRGVETHIGKILKLMWIGFGIALFFTILFSVTNGNSPIPFILILTAFATYIFALGIMYLPFMMGSACILILGAACFWFPYETQLLAFVLAIFLGYLIPGIMLSKKYKAIK